MARDCPQKWPRSWPTPPFYDRFQELKPQEQLNADQAQAVTGLEREADVAQGLYDDALLSVLAQAAGGLFMLVFLLYYAVRGQAGGSAFLVMPGDPFGTFRAMMLGSRSRDPSGRRRPAAVEAGRA